MIKVKNIMVKDVITVDISKSVKEAAELMSSKNVGCLLVEEEGRIKGIITERDIVRRIVATGRDPEKVKIGDIMTSPIVVVSPEATVEEAAKVMVMYKIRRLPVVEEGKLVGLVTTTDLANYLSKVRGLSDPILQAIIRGPPEGGPYG